MMRERIQKDQNEGRIRKSQGRETKDGKETKKTKNGGMRIA